MKLLLPAFLFVLFACSTKTGTKKTGKYTISMDGLDSIKIGMKQTELEKILNQKLVLKNAESFDDSWVDTARVKYKDADLVLYFQRQYPDEDTSFYMFLTGVECKDAGCVTDTGIGIGSSKEDIINTYDHHLIYMRPEDVIVNDSTWTTSKTRYLVFVLNEFNRQIFFTLDNKKVSAFEASIATEGEGDE